jgi:hypothetical protein
MSGAIGKTPRPGLSVGPTHEFTNFFRVRPGEGAALRRALEELGAMPEYREPGRLPIPSIHEARFVLFDNDTRLLFATSHDGPWENYIEDFAATRKLGFAEILALVEGPGGGEIDLHAADANALKALFMTSQETASGYARNYEGTTKEIRKALRVNQAFQQVLDDPAAAEALAHPALKPLLDEAAE